VERDTGYFKATTNWSWQLRNKARHVAKRACLNIEKKPQNPTKYMSEQLKEIVELTSTKNFWGTKTKSLRLWY